MWRKSCSWLANEYPLLHFHPWRGRNAERGTNISYRVFSWLPLFMEAISISRSRILLLLIWIWSSMIQLAISTRQKAPPTSPIDRNEKSCSWLWLEQESRLPLPLKRRAKLVKWSVRPQSRPFFLSRHRSWHFQFSLSLKKPRHWFLVSSVSFWERANELTFDFVLLRQISTVPSRGIRVPTGLKRTRETIGEVKSPGGDAISSALEWVSALKGEWTYQWEWFPLEGDRKSVV